tara:strand:- start:14 stop:394 length:381 start_codon:yes stop_codon:yes gene_type:complete
MNTDKLQALIDKAVGSKEKPASPWTGVLYVFLSILALALMALPVILARRKAAKIAHERDVLLEEKRVAEDRAQDGQWKEQADEYAVRAKLAAAEATVLDEKLDKLHERREKFAQSLESITSWEDLE